MQSAHLLTEPAAQKRGERLSGSIELNTRARRLMALGFTEAEAWRCACNGRGPWWNAGSSHMNAAFPAAAFQRLGLVSILATVKAHA